MADVPPVSVCIVTRNRAKDLVRALDSCLAQDYEDVEILVYDDASTDETESVVRARYPEVRYVRSVSSKGYIMLRNKGLREARGSIVFSLDDDAYYTTCDTISKTVQQFQDAPQTVALALPFVEPNARGNVSSASTLEAGRALRSFTGCAYAIRKEAALAVGGYRDFFLHQGEERDLCIRLMDGGGVIALADTEPVVHTVNPSRDSLRIMRLGIRNTLLFSILNLPLAYVAPALVVNSFQMIRHARSLQSTLKRTMYVVVGLCACIMKIGERRAVAGRTYRTFRGLPAHGPVMWSGGELPKPAKRAPSEVPHNV